MGWVEHIKRQFIVRQMDFLFTDGITTHFEY